MPRKNPLSTREQIICHRLRQWRKMIKLPQTFIAQKMRVSDSYLASIEHARTPLQYRFIYPLILLGYVNAHWLATGKGTMISVSQMSLLTPVNPESRDLFSQIYDRHIASSSNETLPTGILGREVARQHAAAYLLDWFASVPDDQVKELLRVLYNWGNNFVERSAIDSKEIISSRKNAMLQLTSLPPASLKDHELEESHINSLDTLKPPFKVEPVTWDYLKKTLSADLSSFGFGAKTKFARKLNVSPQVLNAWLSGAAQPSAETTLELYDWVQLPWADKQKTLASATNTHKGKRTQQRKRFNESKSGPPRKSK
jgi:transcriptional regulator with XRE-family HTH domain